jgi:hypothetical protein
MEYLFTIFAIVWIVFNLPVPPAGGVGTAKWVVGLVGIVLLVLIFLEMVPRHG